MNNLFLIALCLLGQITTNNNKAIQESTKSISSIGCALDTSLNDEETIPSLLIGRLPYQVGNILINVEIPDGIIISYYYLNGSHLWIDDSASTLGSAAVFSFITDEEAEGLANLVLYTNIDEFNYSIFSLKTEFGVFLSQESLENCYDHYFTYMFENGEIDAEEYFLMSHSLFNESYSSIRVEEPAINRHDPDQFNHNRTKICGTITWGSNRLGENPLCGNTIKVTAFDHATNEEFEFGETTTDLYGRYSFYLSNQQQQIIEQGAYIHISILAEVGQAIVSPGLLNGLGNPYEISTLYSPVTINKDNIIDAHIDVESSILGHAFCISQAYYWGNSYVRAMEDYQDNSPNSSLTFAYPGLADLGGFNSAFCTPSFLNYISLEEHLYLVWDVILHEYGHYLQKWYGCADWDFIYDAHHFSENLIERKSKEAATRLAWQEAWPNAFAVISLQYFVNEMVNFVETDYTMLIDALELGNESKEQIDRMDNDGFPIFYPTNLEKSTFTNINAGDTCEGNIVQFLYDLYDSSAGGEWFDNISIGHKGLWDLVTRSNAHYFSDFIQYISGLNIFDTDELGSLLSYYSFSPDNVRVDVDNDYLPIIIWEPSNDWQNSNEDIQQAVSNFHVIKFYDCNRNYICEIQSCLHNNSVQIPRNVWKQICQAQGNELYVCVYGYSVPSTSTTGNISTGPYFTRLYCINKPNVSDGIINLFPANYLTNYQQSNTVSAQTINLGEKTITVSHKNISFINDNTFNLCLSAQSNESFVKYHLDDGFYEAGVTIFGLDQATISNSVSISIYYNDGINRHCKEQISLDSLNNSCEAASYFNYSFSEKVYDLEIVVTCDSPCEHFDLSIGNVFFDTLTEYMPHFDFHNDLDTTFDLNNPPYIIPIYHDFGDFGDFGDLPIFIGQH